ncbi:MAG: hypothetical protein ABR924_06180 [Terracidiphilus sp.]
MAETFCLARTVKGRGIRLHFRIYLADSTSFIDSFAIAFLFLLENQKRASELVANEAQKKGKIGT